MVQEKYGTLRGSGNWKIPTGVVDEVYMCYLYQQVFNPFCICLLKISLSFYFIASRVRRFSRQPLEK